MSRESTTNLQAIMKKQMNEITQRVQNNVERQLLVISYLDGLDTTPQPKRVKRASSSQELDDSNAEQDSPPLAIPDDALLPRQAAKYASWKKELVLELLHFVEPKAFPIHKVSCDSVTTLRQIMEYAFDVCAVELNGCCGVEWAQE
eukprot:2906559-Amphidinium_carterae.1